MRRPRYTTWLVPVTGVLLTAFLFGLALVLSSSRDDAERDAKQRAVERVGITAALMDSILKGTSEDSVASELTGDLTPEALERAANDAFSGTLTVVQRHGRVIATHPPNPKALGTDLSGEPHVKRALQGQAGLSRVIEQGDEPVIELAIGARAPEGMRAMIVRFPLSLIGGFMAGQLDRVGGTPNSEAFLVDDRSIVVATQEGKARAGDALPDRALSAAMRGHRSGTYETADGGDRFFASQSVPFGPWRVVLSVPVSELVAVTDATPAWVLWVMFFGLALASIVALVLLSRLSARGHALSEANAELAESNREIVLATEAKTRFLANMSHELRTPLNGVIGFAELMYDGRVGKLSPQHREYMGDILTSARHLLQLINEVLDIAKVESGQIPLNPEPVDLEQLVAVTLDGQRSIAEGAGVSLSSEIDPQARRAVLDPARFTQVLLNYLSNAVKFTPRGGSVVVRLKHENADHVRLEVQDTGPGIAPEHHDRIFVEFTQLHNAPGHGGTGLGLALCKRIVEAQGGTVGIDSSAGEGARFFAVFPANQSTGTEREDGAERMLIEAQA